MVHLLCVVCIYKNYFCGSVFVLGMACIRFYGFVHMFGILSDSMVGLPSSPYNMEMYFGCVLVLVV